VVSASQDRTARLWNRQTGQEIRRFDHHTDICFSPDGKLLATASLDRTVRYWEVQSGRNEVFVPPTPRYMTTRNAALSPDGSLILVASEKVVQVWDVATATKCGVLEGHSDFVRWIAFSRDGKLVVTASQDCSLRTWDVQTRKEVACFTGHTGPVWTAEFSPDGLTVASGGEDKAIRVWNATTGWRLIKILGRHKHWILAVSFSPDGKWMASSSRDRTTRIYD
ncbi:WD40-repeat-containing domain protein, partial [Zopfochytrium polystomum]